MNYSFDTSDIEGGADGPRRYRSLPENLVQTLRRAVDRNPAGEALVEMGGDRVTYTQLWDRAARVAGGLRQAGVQPGDRVALRLPNGTDWAVAFWGIVLAGAVVVPVNLRFAELAETDVSTVRSLNYGGAPIAPHLVTRIQEAFPRARVGNGFGLTETAALATYLPHEWAAGHADSVGFPVPVDDLRVADPDPATGAGELLIRGPNVVAGYWRKPQQTAETFADGWLHSGDIARVAHSRSSDSCRGRPRMRMARDPATPLEIWLPGALRSRHGLQPGDVDAGT